jgi:hypothetical protein
MVSPGKQRLAGNNAESVIVSPKGVKEMNERYFKLSGRFRRGSLSDRYIGI